MLPEKTKKILEKQHYRIVGKNQHSAVQICTWTKKSLRDAGICYKEKFYGIKSHRCCQMTPAVVFCDNRCLHCWRAIELTESNKIKDGIDLPNEIIDDCINQQRKLLIGFKDDKGVNKKKYLESQEPKQFAISLSGEPTIYPKIGELIIELRKRGKTSFLVTNGLHPEKLKELMIKKQLPTQLYISVNAPNEKLWREFHRSLIKNGWKRLNESLELMKKMKGKTRSVIRLNLVRDLNMNDELIPQYAKLIEKSSPLFIEVKGYMSVGSSRKRLSYDRMPFHEDILEFSKKLVNELNKIDKSWKILDDKKESRVALIGRNKKDMKIQQIQI